MSMDAVNSKFLGSFWLIGWRYQIAGGDRLYYEAVCHWRGYATDMVNELDDEIHLEEMH